MKRSHLRISMLASALTLVMPACEGQLVIDEEPLVIDEGQSSQRWTGNSPECPGQVPAQLSVCGLPEGQICAYWSYNDNSTLPPRNIAQFCACREASEGQLVWDCYHSGEFGTCPTDEQPVHGSSCDGYLTQSCPYPPRTECTCSSEGATWRCADQAPEAGTIEHPTELDGAKRVAELDDAEREAWCRWYLTTLHGPGAPEPPTIPLTPEGYTLNFGCRGGNSFVCDAHMPTDLPIAYCVGNLRLSSCEAPVAELSDCLITLLDECWPSPHGCARYLEKPGCDGTIMLGGSLVLHEISCSVRAQ